MNLETRKRWSRKILGQVTDQETPTMEEGSEEMVRDDAPMKLTA